MRAQRLPRAGEAGHDGALGGAEHLGDFPAFIAAQHLQHQRLAIGLRQRLDQLLQFQVGAGLDGGGQVEVLDRKSVV